MQQGLSMFSCPAHIVSYTGELLPVQIDIDEPRGLPAPRLICFEIDLTGYLLG